MTKYKKFVATAATATLVASAIVPVASAAGFSDVENNAHAQAINALAEQGVINGYPDGTFKPNKQLTRSDVVKLLGKYLVSKGYEVPADAKTKQRFNDIPVNYKDQELVEYAALVKDAGVFQGSNGNLNATINITRGQMALVVVRALDALNDTDLVSFVAEQDFEREVIDLDAATKEQQAAIDVLDYFDITKTPNYDPKGATTRGQFASFLYRAINVEIPSVELTVKNVKVVDAKTLNVTLSDDTTHVVTLEKELEANKETEVTFIIDEKEYTATVTYVVEDPQVVSVTAINATQVQVTFNKAIDKDSVIEATGKNAGTLVDDVFSFRSLENPAKTINADSSNGSLSEDGKTLTITAGSVFEGRYDVTIDGVKDKDGKAVKKYEVKNLDLGKDTTAPTITNIEKVNASTVKVHFSEPLSDEGNWTFKNAKGEDVAVTTNFTSGDSAVTLVIDADVAAGTEITASVIGAKDKAGNLLSPNPTSVTFTKGDKDGVKPEVSSVTVKGLNKFEIKFSEEVQGLAVGNIYIGGTALTSNDTISQDATDKTKYEVTLKKALKPGLHKIEVKDSSASTSVTDLSGEKLKDFSQLVEFKADKVQPKFVSSEVIVDSTTKEEKLVLTFDKEVVQPAAFSDIVAIEVNKDLVTTEGTLTAGQLTVNPNNKKQLVVVLNTVNFKPNGSTEATSLAKDATYTVKFAKDFVSDTNTTPNKTEAFEVTFKRGEDGTPASTAKPSVSTVAQSDTDNNKIDVKFDKAVDGVTATNVANYMIAGLEIEKATLNPVAADGSQTVTLTLKKGTNELSGERDITIQNVKAKDANVMDTVTKTVMLKENVAPTVTNAKFTSTDSNGKVNKITLTFSEAVTVEEYAFELFVGDETTAVALENTAITTGTTTVELTVAKGKELDADAIAKSITVKLASNKVVKDAEGNVLDFTSIKAGF